MTLKKQSLSLELVPKDNKFPGGKLKVGDKVVINPVGHYKHQGRDGQMLLIGEVVNTMESSGWNILVRWPYDCKDSEHSDLYYEYSERNWDVIPLGVLMQGFTE